MVLGSVYLGTKMDDPLALAFISLIFLVGAARVALHLAGAIGRAKKDDQFEEFVKSRKEVIELSMVMETIEGGQEAVKRLEQLLNRALQIRKCKTNSDAEAFAQASMEAEEVNRMRDDKN